MDEIKQHNTQRVMKREIRGTEIRAELAIERKTCSTSSLTHDHKIFLRQPSGTECV